jgi:hypothetical protein
MDDTFAQEQKRGDQKAEAEIGKDQAATDEMDASVDQSADMAVAAFGADHPCRLQYEIRDEMFD